MIILIVAQLKGAGTTDIPRRGILFAISISTVLLFSGVWQALADIIIPTEIVMKTIVKLSTTVFSTESERNKPAKIKANDIQQKVITEHGKEIFLTFCNTLNEILVSLITNIASSVKFSVQKESMWRKFQILRCSVLKDVWKSFLASLHINYEHQDPLLMQYIFDECFNSVTINLEWKRIL